MKTLTRNEVLKSVRYTNTFYRPSEGMVYDFEEYYKEFLPSDYEVVQYKGIKYVLSQTDDNVDFIPLHNFERGFYQVAMSANLNDMIELTDCGYGFLK